MKVIKSRRTNQLIWKNNFFVIIFYVRLFISKLKNLSQKHNFNKLRNYHFNFFDRNSTFNEKKFRIDTISDKKSYHRKTKYKIIHNKRLRIKLLKLEKCKN